ncbi:MAG: hypothetical protein IPM43_01960 [Actinomycetota bacterium]|nr:MAG: hypothetical protein IPM43_01960 [Actinomycetota bacterium]
MEKAASQIRFVAGLLLVASVAVGALAGRDIPDAGESFDWVVALLAWGPVFLGSVVAWCSAAIVAVLGQSSGE